MTLHDSALATLRDWEPPSHAQAALREAYVGLLLARPDACLRSCVPGHLTASTLVVNRSHSHLLLTHHGMIGRWLQFGGHPEPADTSLLEAAGREAREESGVEELLLDADPIHLDVHAVTCRNSPPTRHFDVRFVAVAPDDAVPVVSSESHDVRWWPIADFPDPLGDMADLVSAALHRLKG